MSRILLVEDDVDLATVFQLTLRNAQFDVRHSGDGVEAIDAAREWKPDLVLLDVQLPGQDGFAACAAIRNLDMSPSPLVVILTAQHTLESKLKGFHAGADEYLLKPIDARELSLRLNRLLEARAAHVKDTLKRRSDAINEIVTTICHEVNNPLTTAVGKLDLLLEYAKLPADVCTQIAGAKAELLRIARVVDRLRHVRDVVKPYAGGDHMIDIGPMR